MATNSRSLNESRPGIALKSGSGKKIQLQLRTMTFWKELAPLPEEIARLHEMLIAARGRRNESIYQMVLVWNKLASKHKNYWTAMHFASEPEYLAHYGLPDGTTLAQWTVMATLFDKDTFVLLGDEVLSFMMLAVGEFQTNAEIRKKDYGEIFNHYCREYESFYKAAFYDMVWKFVQNRYEQQVKGRARRPQPIRPSSRRGAATALRPPATKSDTPERPAIDRIPEKIDTFSGWLKRAAVEALKMSKRERLAVHGSLSQLISEAEQVIKAIERSYKE